MSTTILSDHMMGHHRKIESLFDDFIWNLGKDDALEAFKRFKWELMKHFGIEEKVIFIHFNPRTGEDLKIMEGMETEHKILIEMMDKVEDALKDGKDPRVHELENILNSHKNFEDDYLYPKMDEELDESIKQRIVSRLKMPAGE